MSVSVSVPVRVRVTEATTYKFVMHAILSPQDDLGEHASDLINIQVGPEWTLLKCLSISATSSAPAFPRLYAIQLNVSPKCRNVIEIEDKRMATRAGSIVAVVVAAIAACPHAVPEN